MGPRGTIGTLPGSSCFISLFSTKHAGFGFHARKRNLTGILSLYSPDMGFYHVRLWYAGSGYLHAVSCKPDPAPR